DRLLIYARISDFCRSSEMATGCSERISEINLADTKDVRVGLAGEDSGVEVRLGNEKFGERLKAAIEMLDTERTTPRGHQITRLDASFDGRIIVGFSPESLRRRN
ncbi:MAG: cell division protein FtsQ/DivIB, partial [Pyrinomonadaceae bacterium]